MSESINASEVKMRAAAYALNMCTVSVSQIVDYADPVIMEQEYDAILNNLNLEKMPKEDAALFEVMERLLDTITFFRINDKERELVDKEYQFKMKNAFWNAVPNFGLIVAGGNPITMAVSLASQVGIGYMNYRRAKAENSLEYERETWELERAAIEQINSIRRHLFDAAWRLSKTYQFKDEYRLTERQIRQYNAILMDPDNMRKYARLDSIKDYFEAYPPFWYHLGHTANLISQESGKWNGGDKEYSDSIQTFYQGKAISAFKKYRDSIKQYSLLREDPITSACCLEYADLMDVEKNEKDIEELLTQALKFAGNRNDIRQLCVFAYLRINRIEKAKSELLKLVNEEYNTVLNSQLLSRLYVQNILKLEFKKDDQDSEEKKAANIENSKQERLNYYLLSTRVNNSYLYPVPDTENSNWDLLNKEFLKSQRHILAVSYLKAIKAYFEKSCTRFNHLIPIWKGKKTISDYYYEETQEARTLRIAQAREAFSNEQNKNEYRVMLEDSEFWLKYPAFFNEMAMDINTLDCIDNIDNMMQEVRERLLGNLSIFKTAQEKLADGTFEYEDYENITNKGFAYYVEKLLGTIVDNIFNYVANIPAAKESNTDLSLVDAEANLREFCIRQGIKEPEQILDDNYALHQPGITQFIEEDLFASNAASVIKNKEFLEEMKNCTAYSIPSILKNEKSKKVEVLLKGDREYTAYINRLRKHFDIQRNGIAVINDKTLEDIDLVLTLSGIYVVVRGTVLGFTEYFNVGADKLNDGKIKLNGINKSALANGILPATVAVAGAGLVTAGLLLATLSLMSGDYYTHKELNIPELYHMFQKLDNIRRKHLYVNEGSSGDSLELLFNQLLSTHENDEKGTSIPEATNIPAIEKETSKQEERDNQQTGVSTSGNSVIRGIKNAAEKNPLKVFKEIKKEIKYDSFGVANGAERVFEKKNERDSSDREKYLKERKEGKLHPDPYFKAADGVIYYLIKDEFESEYKSRDHGVAHRILGGFANVLSRQIMGTPHGDIVELPGNNYIEHRFNYETKTFKKIKKAFEDRRSITIAPESGYSGSWPKNGSKNRNPFKEIAWLVVHGYLLDFGDFARDEYLYKVMTFLSSVDVNEWNKLINSMQDVPNSIKKLFLMNQNGETEFCRNYSAKIKQADPSKNENDNTIQHQTFNQSPNNQVTSLQDKESLQQRVVITHVSKIYKDSTKAFMSEVTAKVLEGIIKTGDSFVIGNENYENLSEGILQCIQNNSKIEVLKSCKAGEETFYLTIRCETRYCDSSDYLYYSSQ